MTSSPSRRRTSTRGSSKSADGRVTWTRFEQLVDGAIVAADPEAAAERERNAREETFARATRSTEDGMRGFYIRAPFPIIARLDATIAHLAEALKALGDDLPADERRVLAVLVLANPQQAVRLLEAYAAPAVLPARALREPGDRPGRPAAPGGALRPHLPWPPSPPARSGSRASARSPRPGSARPSAPTPGSRSSRSSTSRARPRSTATRSPTDIDRPCI